VQLPRLPGESGLRGPESDLREGHLLGEQTTGKKRSAKRSARRVRIGVPDGSLTALAGLAAVDELTGRLGMVTELDRGRYRSWHLVLELELDSY
jgi:hypothetical protein